MFIMSGDSTNEWLRYLFAGSSGWSIWKPPPFLARNPFTRTVPLNPGSLPSEAQAELCRTAVRMVAEGRSNTEVPASRRVARATVGRWVKTHAQSRERALDARRRGRRRGHT